MNKQLMSLAKAVFDGTTNHTGPKFLSSSFYPASGYVWWFLSITCMVLDLAFHLWPLEMP
ncbi:MAG: hypothetical protein CM15mP8_1800 [Methanobacteriota archaeon]|nr:MAG: hypothetical protein CM15mP8_1800 [Euryarchaeota archaeon]